MDDEERLEAIGEVLERFREASADSVILVEGLKDVTSLSRLGIQGDIFCVQSGGGPVRAAEYVWRSGRKAIIMTDWDRRGGSLAGQLRENLSSLDVQYDDSIRSDLSYLTRPFAKDVESLDSVVALLSTRQGNNYNARDPI